jgi:WD40 repeat protein
MQAQTVNTLAMPKSVYAMIFNPNVSPNGALVVSTINYLFFYDAVTLDQLTSVKTNRSYTSIQLLQPSGNVIVGGSYLDIYNTTGAQLFTFNMSSKPVYSLQLLPDNQTIVLGLQNGTIQFLDSITYALGSNISVHTDSVMFLAVTPDLFYFMSGAIDAKLILWTWSTMSLSFVKSFSVSYQVGSGVILAANYLGNNYFLIFFF